MASNWRIDDKGTHYKTFLDLEEEVHPELEGYAKKNKGLWNWEVRSEGKVVQSGEAMNEKAAKQAIEREAKELLKDLGTGAEVIAADEMELIHLSDWNMEDKAYKFPSKLMKELHDRMVKDGGTAWQKQPPKEKKKMDDHWDWFFKHAKLTKGVEDADVFLDYSAPKESASEWAEYYEGSEAWK